MFFTMASGEVSTFKIQPYATENALLSAMPAENTVGVVTDSINGYIFSSTEPENPVDKMLWVQLDSASPVQFPATRKKDIFLNPVKAYIYTKPKVEDDAPWSVVVAYLYLNGKWNVFGQRYLYNKGEEYEDVTGNWAWRSYPNFSTTNFLINFMRRQETSLFADVSTVSVGTDGNVGGTICCVTKVDLTHYKTLTFKGLCARADTQAPFAVYGCWTALGEKYTDNLAASVEVKVDEADPVVIDVSALQGEHCIGVCFRNCTMRIDECYLEM